MIEWQPIKTAPKDGTPILVFSPSADHDERMTTVVWDRHFGEWSLCIAWGWDAENTLPDEPTHWAPLQEPS